MGTGIFATWQPEYAKYGLPTFPVGEHKIPAIRGYLKIGLRGSQRIVPQFSSAMALGIALGHRTGLTVLDIDCPDERLLRKCLDRHGSTSIVVRTGSGSFQAWYKHNGERRRIRSNPAVPIDMLGAGFVVAPPSEVAAGRYEFIQGSLADLPRLLIIREPESLESHISFFVRLPVGLRNHSLFRFALREAHYVDDYEALLDAVQTENEHSCEVSLGDNEIRRLVASAWTYQVRGRNLVGHKYVPATYTEIDDLVCQVASPDAIALLLMLRRMHFGRPTFALAKPLAHKLQWTLPRFRKARQLLEEHGYIQCLHRGGMGKQDPPIFRLTSLNLPT